METNEINENIDLCQIYTYKYTPVSQSGLIVIGIFLVIILPIVTFFVFDYNGIMFYFVFGLLYILFFIKRQRIDRIKQLTIYFKDEYSQFYKISMVTEQVVSLVSGDVNPKALADLTNKEYCYNLVQEFKKGKVHPDIIVRYLYDLAIDKSKYSKVVFTYKDNEKQKSIKIHKSYFKDE